MVKKTNRKIKLGMDWVIKHIPSRRNNPQTNGKIERWSQEYLRHRNKFNSANELKDWYNDRIHGSLEIEWGETPNEAFVRKMQLESILGRFLRFLDGEKKI